MPHPIPLHPHTVPALVPSPVPLIGRDDVPRPDLALRRGELVRIRRGVYAPTAAWAATAPWERYLTRVHAVALTVPDAVFSHESAAALRGLPIIGDPGAVHVLRSAQGTSRENRGLRVHTTAAPADIEPVDGLLLTGLAETVVGIARLRHPAYGLAVADAALRAADTLTVEALVAHNELGASSRGRRNARWALHRATALAETTLESISRAAIEWLGFEEPVLQTGFVADDGTVDRADFAWPSCAVVGEADGALKYDGRYGTPAEVVRREKRREDRIRRGVSGFARWGWAELRDPWQLDRILRAAGVPCVRPAQTTPLYTLQSMLGAPRR